MMYGSFQEAANDVDPVMVRKDNGQTFPDGKIITAGDSKIRLSDSNLWRTNMSWQFKL